MQHVYFFCARKYTSLVVRRLSFSAVRISTHYYMFSRLYYTASSFLWYGKRRKSIDAVPTQQRYSQTLIKADLESRARNVQGCCIPSRPNVQNQALLHTWGSQGNLRGEKTGRRGKQKKTASVRVLRLHFFLYKKLWKSVQPRLS